MVELTGDPFYALIRGYDRCAVSYCLAADDAPYRGLASHTDALAFAMRREVEESIGNQRRAEAMFGKAFADQLRPWTYDLEKAKAVPIDPAAFLYVPERLHRDKYRSSFYDYDTDWVFPNDGGPIPYWFAFLEEPHGTGYEPADFRRVNAALFPAGTDALAVYEWTTDWSDWFDAGHEWWGAACWSVYDPHLNRYAVLLAASTD